MKKSIPVFGFVFAAYFGRDRRRGRSQIVLDRELPPELIKLDLARALLVATRSENDVPADWLNIAKPADVLDH